LYENTANGTLLPADKLVQFRQLMPGAVPGRLLGIVKGRTAAYDAQNHLVADGMFSLAELLGLTTAQADDFVSRIRASWKPGGYSFCDKNNVCVQHRTIGGWVTLPWKNGRGQVVDRQYVFGGFVNDAATPDGANLALDRSLEVMRAEV